jgi:GNAT superfamily N-acetyltransferase
MAGEARNANPLGVPDLHLRLARNDAFDSRSFCDLFNSLYSRKVDHRYYSWQFFETPFPSCHAVATAADGAWIGCFGCHIIPSAADVPPIGWMIDLMIQPAFRGKGIFRRLADFLFTSIAQHKPAALCALSNENADLIFTGALGWNRPATITTCTQSTEHAPKLSGNFDFRAYPRIETGVLASIANRFHIPLATHRRSEKFLKWRFAENPWYPYQMLVASQRGADVAAVVIKKFQDPQSGNSFGDIVDVFWSQEDPILLRDLLSATLQHFKNLGIRTASTWLQTNTAFDLAGKEMGFTSSIQKRYYNCRIFDDGLERLRSPQHSFLTMAATDLF